jgi:hypothetical protein
VLAFTGRYPQNIFDFVLGLNRWVIRVAAYAALMTDVYPPFRLDLGSDEPGGARWAVGPDTPPPGTSIPDTPTPDGPVATRSAVEPPPASPTAPSTWTAGRVIGVVVSSCVLLVSVGLGAAGLAVLLADGNLRKDGFVMSGAQTLSSPGYALTTDTVRLEQGSRADALPQRYLGSVRVTVAPRQGSDVFVGIASAADAARYLGGVAHTTVTDVRPPGEGGPVYRQSPGRAPVGAPGDHDIWVASASGAGPRSVEWVPRSGSWVVVVMNPDGSRPVSADVSVGAQLPVLRTVAWVLLALAALGLVVGGVGLALSLHRSSRTTGERGAVG